MPIKLQLLTLTFIFCLSACNNTSQNNNNLPLSTTMAVTPVVSITTTPPKKTCQELKASGAVGWYPLFMTNPDSNQPYGLGIDIISQITDDLGITLKVETDIPWRRQLIMLEEGHLDMILGAYWTEERDKTYIYTEPFMQDEVTVFVLKGEEFSLSNLGDLHGKSGTIPSGGSYGQAFDEYAREHLTIDEAENKIAIFQKLTSGYSQYVIFAYWDATAYLREHQLTDTIVSLPYAITINDVHLLMSRRSPCAAIVEEINQRIKVYQQNGTITTMIEAYR